MPLDELKERADNVASYVVSGEGEGLAILSILSPPGGLLSWKELDAITSGSYSGEILHPTGLATVLGRVLSKRTADHEIAGYLASKILRYSELGLKTRKRSQL